MTTQLTLWPEGQQESQIGEHTILIKWADGDTSEEALRRLLTIVEAERNHYLCGYQAIHGRIVFFYANIAELWIADGAVWARGVVTPEGAYVRECQAGMEREVDDEED